MLIDGTGKTGIENLKNPKAFIYYSQTFNGVYKNLKDYTPTKKERVLVVFDGMIPNMESIKTELFLRGNK